MKKTFSFFIMFCLLATRGVNAAIDPADLVLVTPESKSKCVEYYNFKDTMYCSTKPLSAAASAQTTDIEKQKIVFDDRQWQSAWSKNSDGEITIEYVPKGDDINNWHELITSQVFPDLPRKVTPKEFALTVIKGIENSGFKPVVKFIVDTPRQVIFEYQISTPENQVQDELQMVTKGDDAMYILHYVIKTNDMGNKSRDQWVQRLLQSQIK